MPSVTVRGKIARPVAEVFAFISDSRNDPKWASLVPEVQQIAGDGPGLGARYRMKQAVGGGKFEWIEIETTTFEEPRELGWSMKNDDVDYKSKITLESTDGSTLFQQTNTILFKSTFRGVIWYFLANVQLRRQLRALRKAIEQSA